MLVVVWSVNIARYYASERRPSGVIPILSNMPENIKMAAGNKSLSPVLFRDFVDTRTFGKHGDGCDKRVLEVLQG